MSIHSTDETGPIPDLPIVTTDNLLLIGPGYSLVIPEQAERRKAASIAAAAAITEVTTPEHAEAASNEIKGLAKIRNEIEKGRNLVKAPVLALGKEIDEKARTFAAELLTHEDRLKKLVGDHALAVEAARRQAEIERQRIERERLAAEAKAQREREAAIAEEARRVREAEEAKIAAAKAAAAAEEDDIDAQIEAARKIDEANAAQRAADEARRAEAAKVEADRLAADRLAEQQRAAAVASRQSVAGVKFPLGFEVDDIGALYSVHPELVTLAVKTRETNDFLKQEEAKLDGGIPTVPGLRVFRITKIQTR